MRNVKTRTDFLNALNIYLPEKCYGVEIGVLYGDFSQMILDIINPLLFVLIDPFIIGNALYGSELNYLPISYSTELDYQKVLARFKDQIEKGQIMVDRDFSYKTVKDYIDKTLDFIYIDGSHLYADVKRDLNDWLPKMKEDSIISGHDYKSFDNFGVIEAVNEFCQQHNFEMIILSDSSDWALKRKT